jgi:regulatory protein
MRAHLTRREIEPGVVEEVVAELLDLGYLDDARFARRFAEDRRALDGWGAERIERRLRDLGVGAEDMAAAFEDHDAEDEARAAAEYLARRQRAPFADLRERQRALAALVRRGFELEVAHEAIRRHDGAAAAG